MSASLVPACHTLQLWRCCGALTDGCTRLHITHSHSVFERLAKRNIQMTDVAATLTLGLWPCVNPDPCGFIPPQPQPTPICPLRLQRSASNWPTSEPPDGTSSELLRSMSTGPAASLRPANTSAPPEVCVCIYICMCVCVCVALSSCLTPSALHLLWLRPWNRWSLWERVLIADLTSDHTNHVCVLELSFAPTQGNSVFQFSFNSIQFILYSPISQITKLPQRALQSVHV